MGFATQPDLCIPFFYWCLCAVAVISSAPPVLHPTVETDQDLDLSLVLGGDTSAVEVVSDAVSIPSPLSSLAVINSSRVTAPAAAPEAARPLSTKVQQQQKMDHLIEAVQPYGMLTAGALFGAGWWAWGDVSVQDSSRKLAALSMSNNIPCAQTAPAVRQTFRSDSHSTGLITLQVIVRASLVQHNTVGFVYYIPGAVRAVTAGVLLHTMCCEQQQQQQRLQQVAAHSGPLHTALEHRDNSTAVVQLVWRVLAPGNVSILALCVGQYLPAAALWQSSKGSDGVLLPQMFPFCDNSGAYGCCLWCLRAGLVATLAVLLMSLIHRDADSDYVGYGDDGDQVGLCEGLGFGV